MVDRVLADGTRRLGAVERLERAVRDFGTELAFGDAPEPEAIRLTRAVANTLTSDVPGLGGGGRAVPEAVAASLAATQADNLALVETFDLYPVVPGTGQPFVPILTPPVAGAAGVQVGGEKTELPSATFEIDGSHVPPELIGGAVDVPAGMWADADAADVIVGQVAAAVLRETAEWIISKLDDASEDATDVGAGIAAVEASGWVPNLLVGSRSAITTAITGPLPVGYPPIVFGPTGGDLYVVALAGIFSGFSPQADYRVFEPTIAGREVAIMRGAIFQAGTGATVAKVAGA
jgi:hypothetical protein